MGERAGARFFGRVGRRLEDAVVALYAGLLRRMPRRAALVAGAALGQLAWTLRVRRRTVLRNLAIALPDVAERERRRIAARAARNFGRTVAEYVRFRALDDSKILSRVDFEGLDVVREALAEGRGAVMVTAHLGSWALYTTALAAAGIPASLLVGAPRSAGFDAFVGGLAGDAIELISKSKAAPRRILRALGAGKVVVMAADHHSSDQRVLVPFLGRQAFVLPLPGSLVAKHGSPLLLLVGHRVSPERHRVRIERIQVPDTGGDADATRLAVAVRYNAALGEAILAHPEQYFWYHRRWKPRTHALPPRLVSPTATPEAG